MNDSIALNRFFVVVAGLFGMIGIGLAAAASHMDDQKFLGAAALMCLVHAPALLALGLAGARLKFSAYSGTLMVLGVVLFAGDLVKRHYTGSGLFLMAAPSGGMTMMAGWLAAGLGALASRSPQ